MKRERTYGKKLWAFAAGHIPLLSTGKEPEFTSHDKVAILNASDFDAVITIHIFYEQTTPVMDHAIKVAARRIRKVRFNDLIDPKPVPLDTPFGFLLRSNVEVIVQFSRTNTEHANIAACCFTPYFLQ